jgi:hypothetical protein
MKKTAVLVLACAFLLSVTAMAAEPAKTASNVPKIIQIYKDEVKMGSQMTYDNLIRQVRQTVNSSNAGLFWVAATPITGHAGTVSFITFHENFADVEATGKTWEKAMAPLMKDASFNRELGQSVGSSKSIIARYREDLSYRPEKFDMGTATNWELGIVKLKPGTSMDFADLEKESLELHKRGNIDEHWVVYQVEYGSSQPTFLFLTGLKSLADLDSDLKDAHKAVFTDAVRRRFSTTAREVVTSEEGVLLAVRPDISRPSQTLVAANPSFWTVKEEPTTVARTKTKKVKGGVEPAAMKETEKKQ